jgi:hypothetical protein
MLNYDRVIWHNERYNFCILFGIMESSKRSLPTLLHTRLFQINFKFKQVNLFWKMCVRIKMLKGRTNKKVSIILSARYNQEIRNIPLCLLPVLFYPAFFFNFIFLFPTFSTSPIPEAVFLNYSPTLPVDSL